MDRLINSLKVLELELGASWEDVRTSYKRLVQAAHPDRFTDEAAKLSAEKRIVEINGAYKQLSDYRKKHGHLPKTKIPVERPDLEQVRHNQQRQEEWRNNARTSFQAGYSSRGKRRRLRTWLALAGIGVVIWGISNLSTSPDQETGDPVAVSTKSKHKYRDYLSEDTEPADDPVYITIGSTIGEVIEAQGKPDRIDNNRWHYGKSWIQFENGRVETWNNDPENPIHVTSPEFASANITTDTKRERISRGSTKSDVARIQGEPVFRESDHWDYGPSRIYFHNDVVTGWVNSPMLPLKIQE